jgi:hypothetical protein
MRGRGEGYEDLRIKTYMDGEIYFSSNGAELSLSYFLRHGLDNRPEIKKEDDINGER